LIYYKFTAVTMLFWRKLRLPW